MAPLVLGGSTEKASGTRRTQSDVDGSSGSRDLDWEERLCLCLVNLPFDAEV